MTAAIFLAPVSSSLIFLLCLARYTHLVQDDLYYLNTTFYIFNRKCQEHNSQI